MHRVFLIYIFLLFSLPSPAQNLPEGFFLETVSDQISYPVGVVHTGSEVSYAWTQDGKIWLISDLHVSNQPVLDLSDEVGFWSDHGMLGVALHPDFEQNGWIYLLYVVDRYHLFHADDPDYDPEANAYDQATIARISRYTLDTANPGQVVADSRKIIIGADAQHGIPITTKSHGIGTLLFGRDKSLLFSVGDGSAPGQDFVGQEPIPDKAYDPQALADGIIQPEENIGAYRAQFLNTYCGKIIRIDPETGEGLSSNPFFDPDRPDEPISKVWALGFRNPFRMTLFPGPSGEGPGDLLVGDVGDWSWEEINLVDGPGLNFGWPVYQGLESYYLFRDKSVPNYTAPVGPGECNQEYFYFKDLIVQPRADHGARHPHPCYDNIEIPESVPTFVHQRPVLTYANWISEKTSTLTPGFSPDGKAISVGVNDPQSPIIRGKDFNGSSSIAGVFYTMDGYPDSLRNSYFHGDFQGWMRVMTFNENRQVDRIYPWSDDIGGIVQMSQNPYDKSLYIVTHDPHRIYKMSFEGNRRPVIVGTPDTIFGPAPLTVEIDASRSYDPEGDSLSFLWEMNGEIFSRDPMINQTFMDQEGKTYILSLTVTDQAGKSSEKDILVSVNNSPPMVEITSIRPGDKYSILESTQWPLISEVSDAEHSTNELKFQWTVFLHHNTHFHQEAQFATPDAVAHIEPLGCGIETYHYRIRLVVEDPLGLGTLQEKRIYPDCDEIKPVLQVFPNPTQNAISLRSVGIEPGAVRIFLHDMKGVLQYKSEATLYEGSSERIDLQALPAGQYMLQIIGENFRMRKKVVITK